MEVTTTTELPTTLDPTAVQRMDIQSILVSLLMPTVTPPETQLLLPPLTGSNSHSQPPPWSPRNASIAKQQQPIKTTTAKKLPPQPTNHVKTFTTTLPDVKSRWTLHPRMKAAVTSSTTSFHVLPPQATQASSRPNQARAPPPLLSSLVSQHVSLPLTLISCTARSSEEVLTFLPKCKCHLNGLYF